MQEVKWRIYSENRFCNPKKFTTDRKLFTSIQNNAANLIPTISLDRIQAEVIKRIQVNPRKAIQGYLECSKY